MSIYTEEGFKNRGDYLSSLSSEYGVPFATVIAIASALVPMRISTLL